MPKNSNIGRQNRQEARNDRNRSSFHSNRNNRQVGNRAQDHFRRMNRHQHFVIIDHRQQENYQINLPPALLNPPLNPNLNIENNAVNADNLPRNRVRLEDQNLQRHATNVRQQVDAQQNQHQQEQRPNSPANQLELLEYELMERQMRENARGD